MCIRDRGIVDGRKKSGRRKSNIRHDSIDSVKMAIEIDPFLSIKRISKNNMFRGFKRFYPSFIISDFIIMHDNARPHVAETIISHVNRN